MLELDESNGNIIHVFVPEKYKNYIPHISEQIHKLHLQDKYLGDDVVNSRLSAEGITYHSYEDNMDNAEICENITYIRNNQKLFTYTVFVDTPQNPILISVNEYNMGFNMFIPTVMGAGGMKIPNYSKLESKVNSIFKNNGYSYVDYYFTSIYDSYTNDVKYMEVLTKFSICTFFLTIIFLLLSIYSFINIYIENYKKKNAVLKFMGFSFWDRHLKFLIGFFILLLAIGLSCLIIIKIAESEIKNLSIFVQMSFIYFVFMILILLFAIYLLYRKDKWNTIKILKGEL